MITFKNAGLSKKEESHIFAILNTVNDPFCDCYITKDNIRLFIRDNPKAFFNGLNQGDKIAISEHGFAAVIGYSDKADRKYLKLLTSDIDEATALVKSLYWNVKCDIFCKIKANNPLKDKLLKCGFYFIGERGKEVLLVHKYIDRPTPNYTFVKDRDED